MLLWTLIILLFGLFAAIGYAKGAIRMLVCFAGLILGLALAFPMASLVEPLIAKKVSNPAWLYFLSPLAIFVLFNLIFFIACFVVHHMVQLRIKFSRSEDRFQAWRRLNRRLGLGIGLVFGATYSLVICVITFSIGTLSVQMSSPGSDPGWLSFINTLRGDLHTSGMEKLAAKFDSTPVRYYEVADMLGLIYHNPKILPRLAHYPPFIGLTEKGEISEMVKDDQYVGLFRNQTDLVTILNHPKTQAVFNNPDLVNRLMETDLEDLEEFLKTGYSLNYQDEKILGRWKVSPGAIMKQVKRSNPSISTEELVAHKQLATMIVAGINLAITTDNEIFVENQPTEVQRRFTERQARIIAEKAAASQVNANNIDSFQDSRMADRYNMPTPQNRSQGSQAASQPDPMGSAVDRLSFRVEGTGRWEESNEGSLIGHTYKVSLPGPGGNSVTMNAEVRNNRLYIYTDGLTLVLHKIVV